MKKIMALICLFALALLIFGCSTPEKTPAGAVESDEIAADLQEIDQLEADLDLEELDEIDSLLAELEE